MLAIENRSENKLLYATPYSAGFDIPANEDVTLEPGETKGVSTGLFLAAYQPWEKSGLTAVVNADVTDYPNVISTRNELQAGFRLVPELQIRARSGLAFKHKVVIIQGVGTVDADYKPNDQNPNEIKVLLTNMGKMPFEIKKGDRIAQGVVALTARAFDESGYTELQTKDGARTGGFGSTGR